MTEPNGPRTLLTGRGLLESPRWHGDRLYFSDWSAGEVLAVDLAGRSEVIARVRSLPLCTAWRPDGRLLIVSSPDGRLLRREPDGSLVTFADLGRPGWNDIVVDGRGNAYVNGAGFNPMAGEEFRPGSVHLVTADGAVRQVADDIAFPNGMAVTADNSTLIVADSYRHQLVGFDIGADGGLSGRRVWADLGDGVPDGICTDAQDAVLVRRRAQPAVRTCHGGRHGAADRQPGPRGFRLCSRRPGRNHAVHRGRRMAWHERIRDGAARQRPGAGRRRRGSGGRVAMTAERARISVFLLHPPSRPPADPWCARNSRRP